jgi:hypothetical protein
MSAKRTSKQVQALKATGASREEAASAGFLLQQVANDVATASDSRARATQVYQGLAMNPDDFA